MTVRRHCHHCGLPVLAPADTPGVPVYCCYGCYLVSRIVGGKTGDTHQAWTILRLGIGALLSMNVMMISLLLYTRAVEPESIPAFRWVLLGLATPAMLILGYPFVLGCAHELRRRHYSLDTLIAAGSLSAFAVSAVHTVRGAGHIYYDTATMLLTLVTFGKLIEATAKSRAGQLVRSLETLLPATAAKIVGDQVRDVPLRALRPDDVVLVRPGARLPVDGEIIEGVTTVEEASFTGEAEPRACQMGDKVIAGSVNGTGAIRVRARQVGEDLLLHRIVRMVEEARMQPAPVQRLAERMAAVFIPAVLAVATLAGLGWLWAGNAPRAGLAALAVLVVACPCAMGIATPLAMAMAIARAAREGILVRGGDVMERIGQMQVLFFDKTGTLTSGRLSVARVLSMDAAVSTDELLGWLAGLEAGSEHAIARALEAAAGQRGIEAGAVHNLEVAPGRGLRGVVTRGTQTREVCAGTADYLAARGLAVPPTNQADRDGAELTRVFAAWEGSVRGTVLLADAVRSDARETVNRLTKAGLDVRLMSGDQPGAVARTAAATGITSATSACLPDGKLELIRLAQREAPPIGMVGDGINDAPALASADVGVALGAGADLARQSGNVVLVGSRLLDIPWLVALSRQARRVVKQNLLWALGYNLVAIAAAALGLLHPLLAALAMVVSSLTLIANSVRLARYPGPR